APLHLVDAVVQRLVDALGRVAAAGRLERLQLSVDGVEVGGKVGDLGDVLVTPVAEGDEADGELGGGFAGGDLVADGPDLGLGSPGEAGHAAGRVQAEDDLDARLLDGLGLVGRPGGQGDAEGGGDGGAEHAAAV